MEEAICVVLICRGRKRCNVGFLIKAVPAQGRRLPTYSNRSVPLVGFDVYHLRSDEMTTSRVYDPIQKYRCGTEAATTMAIEIDGADLGRSNPVRIQLSFLHHSLVDCDLVFQAEATG